ncbi:hypothetical protein T484DRAFT_1838252 [Baffinella frigidus]|nr:hypothetical protein T484DRAFT_1838252 [Cryptophyta sp. CCMP2293]
MCRGMLKLLAGVFFVLAASAASSTAGGAPTGIAPQPTTVGRCGCGCLGVIGQSVNCAVCMLHFTQLRGGRAPKVWPCGHTICLRCTVSIKDKICPVCRFQRPLRSKGRDLPNNYLILGLIAESRRCLR